MSLVILLLFHAYGSYIGVKMKTVYIFVNGDTSEINVRGSLAEIIEELERFEKNNEQTETRRHVSLEVYDKENILISSKTNIVSEVITTEEYEMLAGSIEAFSSRDKQLFYQFFIEERKMCDIAKDFGVGTAAISKKIMPLRKKNFFSKKWKHYWRYASRLS